MSGPMFLLQTCRHDCSLRPGKGGRRRGKMLAVDDLRPGAPVQTPLGKGLVREVLNGARLRVEVGARAVVFRASEVSLLEDEPRRRHTRASAHTRSLEKTPRSPAREIDLHGLTVEEAMARLDEVLNEALLAGVAELRIIHGRSGGRIRGAVHARLKAITAVASFRIDPRNAG